MQAEQNATSQSLPNSIAPSKGKGARLFMYAVAALMALVTVYRFQQAGARKKLLDAQREAAKAELGKKASFGVVRPAAATWTPTVELTGTLKPWNEADLSFETPGRLVKLGARMGDNVKVGALLGMLDASRAGAQVGQAQAQVQASAASLAMAEDNLTRTEKLFAAKAVTEAAIEQARQQVALARAQLAASTAGDRLARSGEGMHSLRAPFSGVVSRAPSSPGAVMSPGVPVFRVEDVSHYRLTSSVSEADLDLVKVGAEVHVLYGEHDVKGRVIAVVPSLDAATRRAPVEIEVPGGQGSVIPGNAFVRARAFGSAAINVLRVPAAARKAGSQDQVFVVENGKAKLVRVVRAEDTDGTWLVRSGLAPNAELLVSPPPELEDGEPVDVKPSGEAKI